MKNTLRLFLLAILTIGLLGSCSKINERLDGIDKRINNLENDKIASVEQQITAIKESIADLGTIRTNIQSLMDAKEAQGEDITALKAKDQELEGKINDLKAYVDTELAKYATKDWANATFATLEKQAEIIADVTKLKQDLAGLDAALDQNIEDLDSSVKVWVNEQLSAYSTTAQMEAKIKALQNQIDALKADNETNKSDIEDLEADLAQLEQDLESAKATIKTAYEKAIKDALESNNGYITEKIKRAISSANGSISSLSSRVGTLETQVEALRGDVDALKGMIQSVTIIPAYSDGSVEADKDGIVYIDCIISPASAVSSLTKANFTILVNEAGAITSSPITKDEWFSNDASKGTISLAVPMNILTSAGSAITVAVRVNFTHRTNLTSDITTEFVPVTVTTKPVDYTVTFDLNGFTGTAPTSQTIEKGDKVTKPTDPTDANHTFAGWYKTKNATTGALSDPWDFDNDTVTADMTLYAQWTKPMKDLLGNDFPSSTNNSAPEEGAWTNENGYKAFIYGSGAYFKLDPGNANGLACLTSNQFTRISDGKYVFKYDSNGVFTLNIEDSALVSIEYDGTGTNYEALNGTYSAPASSPTFKAVYDTTGDANTLTFYYDAVGHRGEGITVYDNLPPAATKAADWGYNSVRSNIKKVEIKESVKNYKGLTSTAYMFQGMTKATGISGAEYLYVSNVTDMSQMFCQYGYDSKSLADVPNVSNWNTENVENMSQMFCRYGYYESTSSTQVPDVSNWNTKKVTDMNYMFASYGYYSTTLTQVPTVDGSNWNTEKVTNMSGMFMSFGHGSGSLAVVPKVKNWETGEVTNMSGMFQYYGYSSTSLNKVPEVGIWNTAKVKNMSNMFSSFAYTSTTLNTIPDVSQWTTSKVNDMSQVFYCYGNKSTALDTVPDVSGWETGEVKKLTNMFEYYGNGAVKVNLDLSGWDLSGLTTSDDSHVFNFNSATFIVKIPAKTGDRDNDAKHWYNSGGTNFIAPPTGKTFTPALAGVFSVSDTKKVHFSKGNLWYGKVGTATEATWNFEAEQYSISSSWDANHVSNFYWSKTASVAYADSYNESGTSASDVLFTNATDFKVNDQTNVWRTLSHDEWKYLFEHHTYKYVPVNNKYGIVIAPDGFSGTIADSYSITDWATAESNGLVFLPNTGYRTGTSIDETDISCIYWTSTAVSDKAENAYRMFFQWNGSTLSTEFNDGNSRGWAVGIRLVTE